MYATDSNNNLKNLKTKYDGVVKTVDWFSQICQYTIFLKH